MIIAIVGILVGLVLVCVGWVAFCMQSMFDFPPTQTEIDLLRHEAAEAEAEDQPLKWMYVADAEAELRASLEPRLKWGKVVLVLGIVVLLASVARLLWH